MNINSQINVSVILISTVKSFLFPNKDKIQEDDALEKDCMKMNLYILRTKAIHRKWFQKVTTRTEQKSTQNP